MRSSILAAICFGILSCKTAAPAAAPPAEPLVEGGDATVRVTGDSLSVQLASGTVQACNDEGQVSFDDGSGWKTVQGLPAKGNYWIGDRHVGYGMCDDWVCGSGFLHAALRELKETGQRDGQPVYTEVPLRGSIKVRFNYFADGACREARALTVTLRR